MSRRRWARSRSRPVLSLLTAVLLGGCAVNELGLVRVRHYENDSAFMVTVEGWGAHLVTAAGDTGLTIGYGRRTYVFRRADAPATVPMSALTDPFAAAMGPRACAPCPRLASLGEPVLRSSKILGVSLDANATRAGIGFGLRYRTVLALPADGNEVLLLKFREGDDPNLHVIIGKEVEEQ